MLLQFLAKQPTPYLKQSLPSHQDWLVLTSFSICSNFLLNSRYLPIHKRISLLTTQDSLLFNSCSNFLGTKPLPLKHSLLLKQPFLPMQAHWSTYSMSLQHNLLHRQVLQTNSTISEVNSMVNYILMAYLMLSFKL